MFLGLGTNIGDRLKNIQSALARISDIPTTYILDFSSIYETAPVGYLQQGRFFNMVVQVSTWIQPLNFFSVLQKIEQNLGRVKDIKWGPRIIDIDILFWGEKLINSSVLTIPHPENKNRSFVQVPMSELAPGFMVSSKQTCVDYLNISSNEITLHTSKSKIEF